MKTIPHPWSPYIIGISFQFPDKSDPKYFVQDPHTGKILQYFPSYKEAKDFALEKSIVLKGKKS